MNKSGALRFLFAFTVAWIILLVAFNLDSIFIVFKMPLDIIDKISFFSDILINNLKNLGDPSVLVRLVFAVTFAFAWVMLTDGYKKWLIYCFYLVFFVNLFVPLFLGLGSVWLTVVLTLISIFVLIYTLYRSAILKT